MGSSLVHPSAHHQTECIASTSETSIRFTRFPHTITVPFLEIKPIQTIVNQLINPPSHQPLLSLSFKHIHGFHVFPPIDVYLNAQGSHRSEKRLLGTLALYGLGNASLSGPGLHESWNVTGVFADAVTQHNWSSRSFALTFDSDMPFPDGGELMIGRVELLYLTKADKKR